MNVAGPLLAWYWQNRRDLPWRHTSDPYAIWVSEAMLQQTQVATVIPYYQRFLTTLPTVQALAAADEESVLKLWEGLGYYSRARNLHRAACMVVDDLGGHFPDTAETLKQLPGVGPYMAGAVASIAFGRPEPVLDGNVERVLTRLYSIAEPAKEHATHKRLWAVAGELLSPDHPGDYNQAMMELGATVCSVRAPRCGACPLHALCQARADGTPEAYPVKVAKKASPHHDIAVGIVEQGGKVLLVRRPRSGLLGGMWEFPGGRCLDGEAVIDGVQRQLKTRFGLSVSLADALAPVPHVFTHRKVTLHPYRCQPSDDRVALVYHTDHRWLDLDQVADLPLPRAHQKIVAALRDD